MLSKLFVSGAMNLNYMYIGLEMLNLFFAGDVLLFLKMYDARTKTISYCGHAYVPISAKGGNLIFAILTSFFFILPQVALSQISPVFYVSAGHVFLKTPWEKEKLLLTSNFSFSHCVFLPVWRSFFHVHVNSKLLCANSLSLEE